ncbi:MAG: hypothetical protein ABIG61_03630 [Planctomycetota bacterium]
MRRIRRAYQRHAREQARRQAKFKRRAVTAGTTAVITLGAVAGINKALAVNVPDPHELVVSQDADADLLADSEEAAMGSDPCNPDQNENEIRDGVELAAQCKERIDLLPWANEVVDPNATYKWYAPQYGLHTCDICGETMAMGPGGVTNPELGIAVQFDFNLTLHYMEHGSFSYAGHYGQEPVEGRADVPALIRAIGLNFPFEPNSHRLPVENDADEDLLSNSEELAIGYRPFEPDQNRNEVPDGVELAERCAVVVEELPVYDPSGEPPEETYKIEHALDGLEQCHVCGQWIHMGGWEIINPNLGLRYPDPNDPLEGVFLPDLALHYMAHGSFDCYGSVHAGRVNLQRLMRVLELRLPYELNEHQLPLDYVIDPNDPNAAPLARDVNDLDGDLMADSEELSGGYNVYNPDQDEDLNTDGVELARQCAAVINKLPWYDPFGGDPPPKETYRWCQFQRGLEQCHICGATVNMGPAGIVNPELGLEIDCPLICIHYMEHGSFSYDGRNLDIGEPLHNGRIDIAFLAKVLEMPVYCSDLGTIYLPGDLNKDCNADFKDFAEFAAEWLGSTDPNEN